MHNSCVKEEALVNVTECCCNCTNPRCGKRAPLIAEQRLLRSSSNMLTSAHQGIALNAEGFPDLVSLKSGLAYLLDGQSSLILWQSLSAAKPGINGRQHSLHAPLDRSPQLTIVLLLIIYRTPVQLRCLRVDKGARIIWRLCVLNGLDDRLNV